jgi:hypothetical protein
MQGYYDCAGQSISTLKPSRPDRATRLADLVWTTCLTWLSPASCDVLLTGTAYHKVRMYDARKQKRPVFELPWRDARVTCLAAQPDGHYVWAANARGCIQVCYDA